MDSGRVLIGGALGNIRTAFVELIDAVTKVPFTPSFAPVSAATVTSVNSDAITTLLLAANSARRGVAVNNTDANALLLKYGETASASSYTVKIPSGGYWEMPDPIYTGIIHGIWEANGSGAAIITET